MRQARVGCISMRGTPYFCGAAALLGKQVGMRHWLCDTMNRNTRSGEMWTGRPGDARDRPGHLL